MYAVSVLWQRAMEWNGWDDPRARRRCSVFASRVLMLIDLF